MSSVLIVDDEQQTISVFHAALAASGFDVVVANSGKTALELTKEKHFDIILLDEMMPDMSGNDVITALKQNPQTANIPVVVLTNYGELDLVKKAISMGASDYILKYQMTPNDLAEKVKTILENRQNPPTQ